MSITESISSVVLVEIVHGMSSESELTSFQDSISGP